MSNPLYNLDVKFSDIQQSTVDLLSLGKTEEKHIVSPYADYEKITDIEKEMTFYADMLKNNQGKLSSATITQYKQKLESLNQELMNISQQAGVSFFQQAYKKHSKFTIVYQKHLPSSTIGFGTQISPELQDQNMTYMCKLYLVLKIKAATIPGFTSNDAAKWAYCNKLGHSIIEYVKMKLNAASNYLDQVTLDTLNLEHQLYLSEAQKINLANMIGDIPANCEMQTTHDEICLFVPLNFYFTKHEVVSFPSLAIQFQPLNFSLKLKKPENFIVRNNTMSAVAWKDYITLEEAFFVSKSVMCENNESVSVSVENTTQISATHNVDIQVFSVSNQSQSQEFSINAPVLCKELFWFTKLQKYSNGSKFLAYQPIYNNPKNRNENVSDELRREATARWVLKYAAYEVIYTTTGAGPFTYTINTVSGGDPDVRFGVVTAEEDNTAYFTIQPMLKLSTDFARTGEAEDILNLAAVPAPYNIATLVGTELIPIVATFATVLPISVGGKGFKSNLVTINGTPLTLKQISYTVDQIEPAGTYTQENSPAVTILPGAAAETHKAAFALGGFSGADFTAPVVGGVTFSTDSSKNEYNEGLADFDVCVYQWDNYGMYLDKSGQTIGTSKLTLNNQTRFELPWEMTNTVIPYEAHTANLPAGAHCYSFCLRPECVEFPSGYSNWIKQSTSQKLQVKVNLELTTGTQQNYDIYAYTLAYNILTFRPDVQYVGILA